jgi:hypothetical protein
MVSNMILNLSAAGARDSLIEIVGIKAGLVIASGDLVDVLDHELAKSNEDSWYYSPCEWLHAPPGQWVRVRAEEFESLIIRVMHAIGALPDPLPPNQLLFDYAQRHPNFIAQLEHGADEDECPFPVTPFVRFVWHVEDCIRQGRVPAELQSLVHEYQRRSMVNVIAGSSPVPWDGTIDLRDLFDLRDLGGETIASSDEPPLIDQRFIDYLQAQPKDLTRMHWRQFEYLVGEFFRRHKYRVIVTPPSGDGGIDIRAIRDTAILGPELVVVQAKRLCEGRQVNIETVKALWTDVNDTSATRGLVATTSVLARGAREFCEARQYRLTSAERDTVIDWLRKLATYPR